MLYIIIRRRAIYKRDAVLQHIIHSSLDVSVLLGVYLAEVELDAEQEVAAKDIAVDVFHIFG